MTLKGLFSSLDDLSRVTPEDRIDVTGEAVISTVSMAWEAEIISSLCHDQLQLLFGRHDLKRNFKQITLRK